MRRGEELDAKVRCPDAVAGLVCQHDGDVVRTWGYRKISHVHEGPIDRRRRMIRRIASPYQHMRLVDSRAVLIECHGVEPIRVLVRLAAWMDPSRVL
jgi:hypothetical protein